MKYLNLITSAFCLFCLLLLLSSCGGGGSAKNDNPQPVKSSEKTITGFSVSVNNQAVAAVIQGTTITLTVPFGTATNALVPTIAVSPKATVSPASGIAQDFSKPISYTVKAEDGTTQVYQASVIIAAATPLVIDCTNAASIPLDWKDRGDGIDYIVKCNIETGNSIITIEPGVKIQFQGVTAGFTVDFAGALNMVGTAAKPIILDGSTATPGSWAGILYSSSNHLNNNWQYVTISHAGGGQYTSGLTINNANAVVMGLSIQNCTFSNNLGDGLAEVDKQNLTSSTFSAFSHNTFTGNTQSPIQIKMTEMNSLDAASSYSGNGQDHIDVYQTVALRINTTISKMNVPYLILNDIPLNQKVTIAAGITLEFAADAGFYISYTSSAGSFIANGTAANPIKFIGGQANTKGYWAGLEFDNTDPQMSMTYCTIDGAGSIPSASGCTLSQKAAITFGGNCGSSGGAGNGIGKVSNSTISNSGGYGITYRTGHAVTLTNDTYSGNTLTNVFTY